MAKPSRRVNPAFDNPPDMKKGYVAPPSLSTATISTDTDNNTNELFHPDGGTVVRVK